jgi:hypothetical protein
MKRTLARLAPARTLAAIVLIVWKKESVSTPNIWYSKQLERLSRVHPGFISDNDRLVLQTLSFEDE